MSRITSPSTATAASRRIGAVSPDPDGAGALSRLRVQSGRAVSNSRSNDAYSFAPALGTTTTQINGLNQITANGGAAATYDARGNIISEGGRTFSYSSENLLTGFTGHGRTMGFTYDPLMRVYDMTTVGLNPRTHLHDGDDMIVQNMSGNFLVRYVYAPGSDEPLYSVNANGSRWWSHADERGSIVNYSDPSGTPSYGFAYDEYGNATALWGNHGFAGTLILGLSQLNYNRARVYDPRLGRFLQTDPIGYGDGMNMYAYVGGDPVNRTDPSGQYCTYERTNHWEQDMYVSGPRRGTPAGPRENEFFTVDIACDDFAVSYSYGGGGGGTGGTSSQPQPPANPRAPARRPSLPPGCVPYGQTESFMRCGNNPPQPRPDAQDRICREYQSAINAANDMSWWSALLGIATARFVSWPVGATIGGFSALTG